MAAAAMIAFLVERALRCFSFPGERAMTHCSAPTKNRSRPDEGPARGPAADRADIIQSTVHSRALNSRNRREAKCWRDIHALDLLWLLGLRSDRVDRERTEWADSF